MATIEIENFTDAVCPWAWSAEPALLTLRWRYGDGIAWTPRMIVLSERVEDVEAKGFTPERQAAGHAVLQERFGMPIDAVQRPRMVASIHAARAVVAARIHAPERADALLRRLRVATMGGALVDEPEVVAAAARHAGLDPASLATWAAAPPVERALRADMAAAREALPAARALDHKLAGPTHERRYTCPTLVLHRDGRDPLVAPGFQPVEVYEALIANLAPELARRPVPEGVEELLDWAPFALATVEVGALLEVDREEARRALEAAGAVADPLGPEAFWALPAEAAAAA